MVGAADRNGSDGGERKKHGYGLTPVASCPKIADGGVVGVGFGTEARIMNKSIHETGAVGRREFLVASAMAAAGFAGVARGAGTESLAGGMPMIQLGAHRVSRLVVGANPINGYSYMGSHTDQHMREYFTVERTTEFLANCEKQGINTHQSSGLAGSKSLEAMKTLRARGSKMHYISLHAGRETIKETDRKSVV